MADMDKIRDGLYLGSAPGADVAPLLEAGITHILTLNSQPPDIQEDSNFTLKYIHCYDIPQTDLLSHFEECIQFIDEALSEPGHAVLVHCAAGVSRSSTIVIAYIMYKEKISLQDATHSVKKQRPNIRPNEGFEDQLRLFECMGSEININNELYRRYRLQMMANQVQSGDTEMLNKLQHEHNTPMDKAVGYYKCAKCRRYLFRKSSIFTHAVGRGEEAFGWQSKQSNQSVSSSLIEDSECTQRCERSIFIEPVQWMSTVIVEIEGKLNCPNCSAKLGSFVWYAFSYRGSEEVDPLTLVDPTKEYWYDHNKYPSSAGEKCPCGTWVAPSFHIQKNKVDLVTPRQISGKQGLG